MYTAQIIATQISNGEEYVWARYLSSDGSYLEPAPYRSGSPLPGWADDIINAEVVRLNSFTPSGVAVGSPKPTKVPDPPTQEQIDFNAWLVLKADWQTKTKELASGLSKTVTQQDVDTAYGLMKQAYKDSYGPFI